MAAIDGPALDLNLLAALEVLLAERNVTRAAKQLGLTQSSMSHTLARLREALGDPILVRSGRAMVATPRAEALSGPLGRALAELRRVVRHQDGFEPASSTRTFALACPDLVVSFLPDLIAGLAKDAPHVRLDVHLSAGLDIAAALGASAFDAALAPALDRGAGLVARTLGHVSFCVLARRGHPALARKRLDLETWLRYPHVVVRTGSSGPGFVGGALERAGRARTIGMTAPTFLVAPFVVAASDCLFAAPRELTAGLARRLDLVVRELPLALPKIAVSLIWHERMQADPGHVWFRERVALVARKVFRGGPRDASLPLPSPRDTGKRGQ